MIDKTGKAISGVFILFVIALGLVVPQLNAEKPQETNEASAIASPAEVVEVTVSQLNLRAGPGTNHPVIQTIKKGELLVVVNDKKSWLEVRLPEDTKCWITKKYVTITDKELKEAVVKAGRINVRNRPETGENVIGHIIEGQKITVLGEKGEWYQIAPTDNLTVWASKKYTRYWGTYARYQETKVKEIQEEMTKQQLTELFNTAEKMYRTEQEIYPLEQNYSEVIRIYKQIMDKTYDKGLREKCDERLKQIMPVEDILVKYREAITESKTKKKNIENKYQGLLKKLYEAQTAPPAFDCFGWLESEGKYIGRPAAHKVTKGGKTLFFLKSGSPDINLDDYYGQYVGVKGNIVDNKGIEAKTIIVNKIQLLNEGE